ncbi:MAG: gliding motility-associated C-terminal domain-containing protein [Chitinophagales bacterium]
MQKKLLSLALLIGLAITGSAQSIGMTPCSCLDNSTQSGLTNNSDGEFTQTVTVNSLPGEVWTIATVTNFYDVASPAPPAAPILHQVGDTIPEVASGIYSITGIIVDNRPFTLVLTNGDTSLLAINTCFYPHPTMEAIGTDYCSSDPVVALQINAVPPFGTGTFSIGGNGVSQLDPSLYTGAQTLSANWDGLFMSFQNPGCNVTLTQDFYVHPQPNLTAIPTTICEGEFQDLNLTIGGTLGDSITEFHDGSPTGPLVSSPAQIFSSTDLFAVSISKGGGTCTGSVELQFNVLSPSSVANAVSICQGDDITVNGHTYNTDGVYMDTLTSANGCDSIIQTILTVNQPTTENLSFTVCEGENVVVNGITYDSTGTYVDHLLNAAGCDSTITISLVVNATSSFTQTLTLCNGESVVVGSNTYTVDGNYNDTLLNAAGCDSFVTTNLSFLPNSAYYQSFNYCGSGSVSVGSHTYTSTGLYSDTLVSANGCDSVITTDLIVNPSDVINQNVNLCQGQSVTVGGNVYNSNGVYNDTMSNMYGCDSIVNTTVYVIPKFVILSETICNGQSFVVGIHSYTTAGSYLDTLLNSLGCDSIVALDLAVLPVSAYSQNVSFCAGGSINVASHTYTLAGTYQDTVLNMFGCDSVITTTVSILASSTSSSSPVICEGDTVFVGTSAYTASGTYMDTLVNADGCDSVITTNLTVNLKSNVSQSFTICAGQSISVGLHTYNTTGTFSDTLSNINGCDSIISTSLNVLMLSSSQNVTICNGQSYNVGMHSYTTAGVYNDTLTNGMGCDSIVTTTLTVNDPTSFSQTLSLCFGQTVSVGLHTYSSNGVYADTLTNAAGCDSVITTDLTILPQNVTNSSAAICLGDSFMVGSHVYYAGGLYSDTMTAANGCDSIVNTDLSINSPSTANINMTVCYGSTYTLNAIVYSVSGSYVQHFTNSVGCDSALTIDFTVLPQNLVINPVTLCNGQSVTVGSHTYNASGIYADTLMGYDGCDSFVNTTLTILPANTATQNVTLCFGQSVTVGSNSYNVNGTFNDTVPAANGCDSMITTNVTVLNPISSGQSVSLCQGDSVIIGNTVHYTAGIFSDTVPAANGCDSVITSEINIVPASFYSQSITICQGQSVTIGSNVYNMMGVYNDTIPNAAGCDSIITTDVTVIPINYSQNFTLCNGQSVTVGSHVYNVSGSYSDTLVNMNSCDSIILTTVNILPALTGSQTLTICQGQSVSVGAHTYNVAGIYTDTLLSSNLCDSLVTTNLVVNNASAFSQNVNICQGQSLVVGLNTYNLSGTYMDTMANSNGCDSVITTVLNVISPASGGQSISICAGHTVTIGTHVYAAAGTYLDTLVSTLGCDSFYLSTEISVNPNATSSQSFTICQGQTITVGSHSYNASGVYNDTLVAANTCDSIITTTLTVTPAITTSQAVTICQGQSITIGAHSYNVAGIYIDTLAAASTCDSIITTTLTVTNAVTASINAHICGGSYSFGGSALTVSGTYHDTIPAGSVGGCDSITTLTLTVGQPNASTVNQSICEGASFNFNGVVLTADGIYRDTILNASGCDSVITLHLTVNPRPSLGADQSDSVCANSLFNLNALNFGGLSPLVWNTASPNAVAPGTYTAIYTDGNGCSDTASAIIIAKVSPAPLVLTAGDSTFCAGTILTHFEVTNIPGAAYTWIYNGTGANLIPNGYKLDMDFSSSATGGELSVSAVPGNLCGTQILSINLKLLPAPSVTLTSSDADGVICVGEQVTLTASGDDVKGVWVNGYADSVTSLTLTISNDTVYNVYAFAVNACGQTSDHIQLIGHALPVADAGIDTAMTKGTWTQLEGSASGSPPFTYAWTPDSTLNYSNVKNPIASPNANATYYLMVMDMYGCMAMDSVNIAVNPGAESLKFPDVITPNGDGNNDVWKIDLDKFPSANLVIFNRWGEVVYESAGYNNDWNGTFQNNGKQLPDGTYYFALKPDTSGTVYKGAINLFNYKK